jgi:hypothetical protein
MSRRQLRTVPVLAALSVCGVTIQLSAAPCGRPDVDLTFPPSDATSVPPNARLSAHYAAPALYDDEPVSLVDATGADVPLTVQWDEADAMLRAAPAQALATGYHELVWPGLRGLSGAGIGRGSMTSFFVGTEPDQAPPTFLGLTEIAWDLSRDRDPCLDGLEDRFVFELSLGEASDDGGTDSLTVQIFETRDPARADGEPERVALRAMPSDGKFEVRRPAEKAGKTCFAAVVQDLLGNVSGGGEREVCVKTKKPPFFDGCSLSAGAERGSGGWLWFAAAVSWLSLRRGVRGAPRLAG